jgi:AraC-like DNA-binding protein
MKTQMQRRSISAPSDPALTLWSDFLVFRNSTVDVAVNRAAGDFPEHLHEFAEISLILSGRARHRMGQLEHGVGKGDFVVAIPGGRHSYGESSPDFRRLVIQVRRNCFNEFVAFLKASGLDCPSFDGRYSELLRGRSPLLPPQAFADCLQLASGMEREWLDAAPGFGPLLKFKLGELLTVIARAISGDAVHGSRLLDAIALIDRDYMRNIGLPELERVSGMGRRTLERAFKAETGLSPKQYILKTRISWACRLLANEGVRIKEIAELCGFKDRNYFARAFRESVGMTPGRFAEASLKM